jgi:hypothetical protein
MSLAGHFYEGEHPMGSRMDAVVRGALWAVGFEGWMPPLGIPGGHDREAAGEVGDAGHGSSGRWHRDNTGVRGAGERSGQGRMRHFLTLRLGAAPAVAIYLLSRDGREALGDDACPHHGSPRAVHASASAHSGQRSPSRSIGSSAESPVATPGEHTGPCTCLGPCTPGEMVLPPAGAAKDRLSVKPFCTSLRGLEPVHRG